MVKSHQTGKRDEHGFECPYGVPWNVDKIGAQGHKVTREMVKEGWTPEAERRSRGCCDRPAKPD